MIVSMLFVGLMASCGGDDEESVDECLAACGEGCPAPEYWICGEDGELYCNECIMNCEGVEKAENPALCQDVDGDQDDEGVKECLENCGDACPAPEYWICGEDENLYCNECIMGCLSVEKADDSSICEDAGVNPGDACDEDGQTADAADGCNTCTCEGGSWSCTEIACE